MILNDNYILQLLNKKTLSALETL